MAYINFYDNSKVQQGKKSYFPHFQVALLCISHSKNRPPSPRGTFNSPYHRRRTLVPSPPRAASPFSLFPCSFPLFLPAPLSPQPSPFPLLASETEYWTGRSGRCHQPVVLCGPGFTGFSFPRQNSRGMLHGFRVKKGKEKRRKKWTDWSRPNYTYDLDNERLQKRVTKFQSLQRRREFGRGCIQNSVPRTVGFPCGRLGGGAPYKAGEWVRQRLRWLVKLWGGGEGGFFTTSYYMFVSQP